MLYSTNVNILPLHVVDKFGCCFVNGQIFSIQYNSTVIKSMFALKEKNALVWFDSTLKLQY